MESTRKGKESSLITHYVMLSNNKQLQILKYLNSFVIDSVGSCGFTYKGNLLRQERKAVSLHIMSYRPIIDSFMAWQRIKQLCNKLKGSYDLTLSE